MTISVQSAIALTEKQKQALETKVAKQFNQDCEFVYSTDGNLIAGLRLVMPDRIIDNTISARLAMLQDQLA